MKNHLKRIAAPRRWHIDRKANTFTTRPKPGAHPLDQGLPLNVILRDIVKIAASTSEVKKILNNNEILVDGKRRKDHRFIVGLFDVVSFNKSQYRVALDAKGRLSLIEIPATEKTKKVCKVTGKSILKGGKIQLNLFDGKNILTSEKVSVGDSVLIELPSCKITKVFPLKEGATIYLQRGKRSGDSGTLKTLNDKQAVYESNGKDVETLKEYLFVIGEKKAEVTIQ